jgi:hypothetical protein
MMRSHIPAGAQKSLKHWDANISPGDAVLIA